jgi:dipeptidyl aminopeptidase/acylaminoacyl peptidase
VPALLIVAVMLLAGCGAERDSAHQGSPPLPEPVPVRYGYLDDLAFGPDDRLYAIRGPSLAIVNHAGRPVPSRRLGRFVHGGALSPGARLVAEFVQDDRASVRIRRRTGGTAQWKAAIPRSRFDSPRAFWSADGSRLVLETEARRGIRIHDARRGRLIRTMRYIRYLGRQPLSPDGKTLVLGDRRGALLVDVATGARRRLAARGGLEWPAWSPDGRQVAGSTGRAVATVDLTTGQARTFPLRGAIEVAWSPDGRFIAAYGSGADDEWTLSVIDVASGQAHTLARFQQGEERGDIAWSADGRRVAFQVARPIE